VGLLVVVACKYFESDVFICILSLLMRAYSLCGICVFLSVWLRHTLRLLCTSALMVSGLSTLIKMRLVRIQG
jgi:hypothetical protein